MFSNISATTKTLVASLAAPPYKSTFGGFGQFVLFGLPIALLAIIAVVVIIHRDIGSSTDSLSNAIPSSDIPLFWRILMPLIFLAFFAFVGMAWWTYLQEFRRIRHYNTQQWPYLHNEWESRWMCLRCNKIFKPVALDNSLPTAPLKFRVVGVNRETRRDVVGIIEAASAENAKIKAELRGIAVGSVTEV